MIFGVVLVDISRKFRKKHFWETNTRPDFPLQHSFPAGFRSICFFATTPPRGLTPNITPVFTPISMLFGGDTIS